MEVKELNYLNAKLKIADSVKLPLTPSCCIYKVPPKLRKVNEEAYTPSVVSIGPYHHGDKNLESMQELKVWYVKSFLGRNPEKSLEDYLKALKDQEDRIRLCYSETIRMTSNEFVRMIFTDACFIIEFFLACAGVKQDDPLAKRIWPTCVLSFDLILLENQLPYFVLTCLFDLAFPGGFNGERSFVDFTYAPFAVSFLSNIYLRKTKTDNVESRIKFNRDSFHEAQHLCDVLRTIYLPSDPPARKAPNLWDNPPGISQLHEAGMKFQAHNDSVTKLKYSEKVLKIPDIVISGMTETMLRNVVAFEQCHYPFSGCVTDYICLLDDLIDSGKDVEILVGKKILKNLLGDSNEVASMVNKLSKNVVVTDINEEYFSLYREMDKFYNNPCHKYKAIFVREYWNTPWKIASVVAATVLLLLTFIQTISSVFSLKK